MDVFDRRCVKPHIDSPNRMPEPIGLMMPSTPRRHGPDGTATSECTKLESDVFRCRSE